MESIKTKTLKCFIKSGRLKFSWLRFVRTAIELKWVWVNKKIWEKTSFVFNYPNFFVGFVCFILEKKFPNQDCPEKHQRIEDLLKLKLILLQSMSLRFFNILVNVFLEQTCWFSVIFNGTYVKYWFQLRNSKWKWKQRRLKEVFSNSNTLP